jgi:hypothetical protein
MHRSASSKQKASNLPVSEEQKKTEINPRKNEMARTSSARTTSSNTSLLKDIIANSEILKEEQRRQSSKQTKMASEGVNPLDLEQEEPSDEELQNKETEQEELDITKPRESKEEDENVFSSSYNYDDNLASEREQNQDLVNEMVSERKQERENIYVASEKNRSLFSTRTLNLLDKIHNHIYKDNEYFDFGSRKFIIVSPDSTRARYEKGNMRIVYGNKEKFMPFRENIKIYYEKKAVPKKNLFFGIKKVTKSETVKVADVNPPKNDDNEELQRIKSQIEEQKQKLTELQNLEEEKKHTINNLKLKEEELKLDSISDDIEVNELSSNLISPYSGMNRKNYYASTKNSNKKLYDFMRKSLRVDQPHV